MKTIVKKQILSVAVISIVQCCSSQGFINLNFESANVSGYSPGEGVPTQDAFPDWSAYYGPSSNPTYSGPVSSVFYDSISTGGGVVSLQDSNSPGGLYGPIQGKYSALLQGSIPAAETTASIGQTGTIPSDAEMLMFWGNISGTLDVSFDGQMLSLMVISNTLNYTEYGADVSADAGQTGQLLFTAQVQASAELDNIQFSADPPPTPEPSTLALCALGGSSLAWHWRKKFSARNFWRS